MSLFERPSVIFTELRRTGRKACPSAFRRVFAFSFLSIYARSKAESAPTMRDRLAAESGQDEKSGRGYAELRSDGLFLFKPLRLCKSRMRACYAVTASFATESGQDEKSGRGYAETAIRLPFALPKRGAPVDFF